MPDVREASFAVFRHFGVDRLFGNPGSTELPMLKAMPFPYVMGLNEAVVMAMADGYARASGKPALVNLHSAAGTGHALGNLFTAYKNNAPVVVTAGQQARSILPYDPFLYAERPTEFPRPYVKSAVEPARAQDVPLALARAFAVALTPPMGPVFVSIPVDDWERECEMPGLSELSLRTHPDPAGIGRIARMLDEARNPCLVVGTGAANCHAWHAAVALAEKAGLAVWAAPYAARETFPEDHPQFVGFLNAWRDTLRAALAPYDAILVAGAPVFTYHVEGDGPHWPPGARLMALSDDPQHLASLPGGGGVPGRHRGWPGRAYADGAAAWLFGHGAPVRRTCAGDDRELRAQAHRCLAARARGLRRGGANLARAGARDAADHPTGRLLFLRQRGIGLCAAGRDRRGARAA